MTVTETIRLYLPWLLSCITIYSMWLAGGRVKHTWLVGLGNQALWLIWIVSAQAWGLLPMNAALWIVFARNHWKWSRAMIAAAPPPSSPVSGGE